VVAFCGISLCFGVVLVVWRGLCRLFGRLGAERATWRETRRFGLLFCESVESANFKGVAI